MESNNKIRICIERIKNDMFLLKSVRYLNYEKDLEVNKPNDEVTTSNHFEKIVNNYRSSIDSFRRAGLTINTIAPTISSHIIREIILPKIEETLDESNIDDKTFYYTINAEKFSEIRNSLDDVKSFYKFSTILPRILVIGLVSVYDGLVGALIEECLRRKPSVINSDEKNIPLGKILQFKSLNDAQDYVIGREVESVTRENHTSHLEWFKKRFSINIDPDKEILSKFVEICERRHLFTHTDGHVNERYIDNCREKGVSLPDDITVGKSLTVSPLYYTEAVNTFFEFGIKLSVVCWRSIMSDDTEDADTFLVNLSYDLIKEKEYDLSRNILEFAIKMKKIHSEEIKRMYCVNLANSYKLSGYPEKSNKLLDEFDWSASSYNFRISVAAIRDDVDEVCELMQKPSDFEKKFFHEWPVFETIKKNKKFIEAYEDLYGIPFQSEELASDVEDSDLENSDRMR